LMVSVAAVLLVAGCARPAEQKPKATLTGAPSAYDRAVAEARKAGFVVMPEDIKTGPVPPEQNAAPIYRQLDAYLKQNPTGKTSSVVRRLLNRTPPTPVELARGRALIAQRAQFFKLIHEAAARPRCDFQRDWSLGPDILFPEYARMRDAVRWLVGRAGCCCVTASLRMRCTTWPWDFGSGGTRRRSRC
jgi:hypothetical protein